MASRFWHRPHLPDLSTHAVLFAVVLTLASSGAAQADERFQASLRETFAPVACPAGTAPGTFCANATGSGTATGMRKVNEVSLGMVNMSQGSPATGCAPEVATTTLTATNGDHLFLTTNGTFCQTGPSSAIDAGTYHVTGGTGRFAGASGGGTYITRASMGIGTSVTTMDGDLTVRKARPHHGS